MLRALIMLPFIVVSWLFSLILSVLGAIGVGIGWVLVLWGVAHLIWKVL